MSIYETIKNDVKEAMKAHGEVKLTTLRGVLSAFTNELVAQKKKPSENVNNEMALTVIKRLAKQRKDSIEQFTKGGRNDLVEQEKKELAILETYLPKQMGKEEIQKIAEAKKSELGITDKSDMGKLMGAVMKETKGMADGGDVKEIVASLLS